MWLKIMYAYKIPATSRRGQWVKQGCWIIWVQTFNLIILVNSEHDTFSISIITLKIASYTVEFLIDEVHNI